MTLRIAELVTNHVKNYSKRYFLLFLAFVIGVSAGAFTVNGLSTIQRDELGNYLQGFMGLLDNQQVDGSSLMKISLLENFKIVIFLWILGVTIIGTPFIFVILGIRGFMTGFSAGFIINAMGLKGILFTFCSIFPKEIIIIPCLIALGVNGINFSLNIIKGKSIKHISKESLKSSFFSYCFVTVFYSCFIVIGIIIEAYVIPVFIRMIAPIISN